MELGYLALAAAAGFFPVAVVLARVARELTEERKKKETLERYKRLSQDNIKILLNDIAYHQDVCIAYKINDNTGAVGIVIENPTRTRDEKSGKFVKPKTYAYEV